MANPQLSSLRVQLNHNSTAKLKLKQPNNTGELISNSTLTKQTMHYILGTNKIKIFDQDRHILMNKFI